MTLLFISILLQNIVKHGEVTSIEQLGKPGIFFISKFESFFIITSGNYILAENYLIDEQIRRKISFIN